MTRPDGELLADCVPVWLDVGLIVPCCEGEPDALPETVTDAEGEGLGVGTCDAEGERACVVDAVDVRDGELACEADLDRLPLGVGCADCVPV